MEILYTGSMYDDEISAALKEIEFVYLDEGHIVVRREDVAEVKRRLGIDEFEKRESEINRLKERYRELEDKLDWVDEDLDGEFVAEQTALKNRPIYDEMEMIELELEEKYGYII